MTRAKQQTVNERLKCSNKEEIYSGLHDKVQSIGHKTETDDIYIYAIFLLKKNVRSNIIKTILGYLPIVTPETFKKWKVAIISVRQE